MAGRFLSKFVVAILIALNGIVQAQNKPATEYSLSTERVARMEQIIDSFANSTSDFLR
jgi:hypothetical protein